MKIVMNMALSNVKTNIIIGHEKKKKIKNYIFDNFCSNCHLTIGSKF